MQKTKDIQLDTFIIVTHGVKGTNLFLTDQGLLNKAKQVIYKRILNSGCIGYFIGRKFKAESKLKKYPVTEIILIKEKAPF
jgi:hypothetical protein